MSNPQLEPEIERGRRVVALVRVSTGGQAAEGRMGLAAQHAAVTRIIADHRLDLVDEIELHHSGAKMLEEPRFLQLLEQVEAGKLYGVVMSDADRLMRPECFSDYRILEAFRASDTKIITSAGTRDLSVDRLPVMLQTEFAAYEREAIRRRTQRAKEILRRQGRKPEGGGLPRGIAYEHKSGKWSYVEPGAAQVRSAFDLVLAGETCYAEISRQTGIPASTVPAILRHPLYAGRFEVRHRYNGHERVERAPEDVIVRDVLDPPLVAPDEFERAQQILRERKSRPGPRPRGLDAPATYAGYLACSQCGSPLWLHESRKNGNTYWQYTCGQRRSGRCDALQISAARADAALDALVPELLGTTEALEEIVLAAMGVQQRHDPQRRRCDESLAALQAQRRRAQHLYEQNLLTLDELREDLANIDREVRRVESRQRRDDRKVELDDAVLLDLALSFNCWQFLPRVHQRAVLRDFGMRFVVDVSGKRRKRKIAIHSVALDTMQLKREIPEGSGSDFGTTDRSGFGR